MRNLKIEEVLKKLDFKKGNGLFPVVVQDAESKELLMLAYANEEALEKTLEHRLRPLLESISEQAVDERRDFRTHPENQEISWQTATTTPCCTLLSRRDQHATLVTTRASTTS